MYGIPEHCQPLSSAEEQVLLAVWACRPPAPRPQCSTSCIGWKKRAG